MSTMAAEIPADIPQREVLVEVGWQLANYYALEAPTEADWDRLVSPLNAVSFFAAQAEVDEERLRREINRALSLGHNWLEVGRRMQLSGEEAQRRFGPRAAA